MRLGVLGAVTAWDVQGRDLDLGVGRAATLLALLVAQCQAPLSPARLADQLWSGQPPATAATTLQGWISRLRRRLEPDVPAAQARLLVTRATGYQLILTDPVRQLDSAAFRHDAARLEAHLRDGHPELAAAAGRAALGRWRGDEPYGGLLDDALPEQPSRLREERLLAVERHTLARLDLGDHRGLLGELAAVVAAQPTRESLVAMRALALYRADRQVEALSELARARALLRDELGLDPGPTLRAVEAAVHQADPAAARPGWWPGRRSTVSAPSARTDVPPRSQPAPPAPSSLVLSPPPPLASARQPALAAPPTALARASSPFVGRAAELERARAVVDLPAGGARALVVSGPAGVGKTRLVTEVLATLPAADGTVRGAAPSAVHGRARCLPGDDAAPYDLCRALFPALAPPAEASVRSWALLLAAALGAEPGPVPAAGQVLGQAPGQGPDPAAGAGLSKIVVDDLQWADAASLRVLAALVRGRTDADRPLLISVTVRDEYLGGAADAGGGSGADRGDRGDPAGPADSAGASDALEAFLAELGRLPGDHLRLRPLASTAVAEYVAAIMPRVGAIPARGPGSPVAPGNTTATDITASDITASEAAAADVAAVAAVVAERSAGNAFFMTELTRLVAAGRPARDLPDRVIDVISSRVAALGEPARGLLRVAAVLGDDVAWDVIAQVADDGSSSGSSRGGRDQVTTSAALDEAFDNAVRAGLIADEPGVVRFAHALVRESLVARTTRRLQADWHRRCADVLLAGGAGVQAVADHLLRGDDPRAAGAALAAAEAALVVADFDGAVSWARRGLDRTPTTAGPQPPHFSRPQTPPPTQLSPPQLSPKQLSPTRQRARLGLAAGRALYRAGRLSESAELLATTYDEATLAGESDLAAQAALEAAGGPVTGYWSMAGETAPDVLARLLEARRLPGLTPATAGAVEAACAARFALAGDLRRAEQHLTAAQAVFEATEDASADLERMVLLARFVTWWRPDLAARRLAVLDRLGALAAGDVGARLTVAQLRALTLLELGELAEADGQAQLLAATARRLRYDDFTLVACWWKAMRDLMSGRLDDARRQAESVFSPLLTASAQAAAVARASVEAIGGMVAWELGALAAALPEAAAPAPTDHPGWLIVRALGLAQAGDADASLAVLAPLLRPGLPAIGSGPPATASLILLTEWCWHARTRSDARDWARPLLERVEPWADAVIVFAPGGVCMGSGQLYVGTLAAIVGDHERARRALDAAQAVNERLGMPLFAARAAARRLSPGT
ncbi:Transcriptional regulatory protein, C terminal [Parafrankia irregularis]|uniref:Transcriptional regulatory protein, C terminal n=1 Tax=Parafrankia irregularis TaxID=795642 RepID=A0A0S4QUN0_9ACTN|nr:MULTISPECIES: BTAD domain-containing putative transcriptional regulator [Parafrankia]MBE3200025.1 AAA family ATPase [Parafrankia sp. CH37]CUU59229.1 Transcriptional regulatory protein, C terminal [Parafrankia irregularis]